tara:strand:+ start:234 stop:554 length:321 start_codon:yes stop_codon:yes gene_type:complete
MPEESKLTEKLEEKQSEVKFTQEELTEVQGIQTSYANITNQLGQVSIARLRVRQQADSVDNEYNSLIEAFNKTQEDEQKFLDTITEKYGQGTLNPETGVFTPNKSE